MLTIKELRKAMRGLDPNMPIYMADHDHAVYMTNSLAGNAEVVNQEDYKNEIMADGDQPEIIGDYLCIRP